MRHEPPDHAMAALLFLAALAMATAWLIETSLRWLR